MSPRQTTGTSSESRTGEAQLNAWNSDCPRECYGDSCWSDLPCLFCTFHHISLANQCALQCLCRLCNANELFVAPNVSKALWLPWLRALLQAQFELAPATPLHLGMWDYNKAHDIPQHHVPGLTDPNTDYLAGSHFSSNSIVIHHRKKGAYESGVGALLPVSLTASSDFPSGLGWLHGSKFKLCSWATGCQFHFRLCQHDSLKRT